MPDLHGHHHRPGWIQQHLSMGGGPALPDKHPEEVLHRPWTDPGEALNHLCHPGAIPNVPFPEFVKTLGF